jgi:hypothetical protein
VHDDADPVARRVLDLGEPALGTVAVGPFAQPSACLHNPVQSRVQVVGADPDQRPGVGDRHARGRPLADHAGCLEAAAVGRPAEDRLVEGGRASDVAGGQLKVVDVAVGHLVLPG